MQAKLKNKMHNLGPLIGLIGLAVIITIINQDFLSFNNIMNLLRQVSINGLIAFGMTLVILTGGIDLSVGSTLAFSSVMMADLLLKGINPVLAILLACLIGMIMGAINGAIITYGKIEPFICTLATMTIFRGLTMVFTNGNPISNISDSFLFQVFGKGYILGIPVPVVTMLIAFIIVFIVLSKTSLGKKIYAVGGSEKVSKVIGISSAKIKIFVYSMSGLLASLAGTILASRLNSVSPQVGQSYELDAIAAVVLGGTSLSGGKGRISGTLIGALIIGVLNNGLNLLGVSSFYQLIVKGVVILFAVLVDRKKA